MRSYCRNALQCCRLAGQRCAGVGSDGGLCNHHHLTPLTRMSYSYGSMRLGPHMRDDDDALSLSACIALLPHVSGYDNVLSLG